MCVSLDGTSISLPNGNQRKSDGTLIPARKRPLQVSDTPRLNATDIPVGDGQLDAARLALLTRRERIREAVEDK